MVISKIFPLLVRTHRTAYSLNYQKISARFAVVKTLPFGISNVPLIRTMSSALDDDVNDPKRHFDYHEVAQKLKEKKAVVIDVREYTEIMENGKIPGSIHIPLGEITRALGELDEEEFKKEYHADKPKEDDEIIFSCRSGARSLKALRVGLMLGYSNAGNYKGGFVDWSEKHKSDWGCCMH